MFVCHFGLYFPVLFICFSVNFSFVYDLPGIRLESVEISRWPVKVTTDRRNRFQKCTQKTWIDVQSFLAFFLIKHQIENVLKLWASQTS